ncbi:TipJ family phage tail tip protein [Kiloniella sp.]|uniref:TipJ family phage tail tip protein n=1 Tax=Kiloniella sp. TaxID=1938587 RepID=UPI003B015F3B
MIAAQFKGQKGGGGGGSTSSVRTPDNLRSQDTMEAILGICEGEIEGLEDGLKSFEINDTKLQNLDGTYNFQEFDIEVYPGSGVEEPIQLSLGGVTKSHNINVKLAKDVSVTRQTDSGDIDFVDIRLAFNTLYKQTDKGVFDTSIEFEIEYKALSATEWNYIYPDNPRIKLSGKTTSVAVKEFRVPTERISEPYEFRVTKITAESDTKTYFREMAWESFQEVNAEVHSFTNTACARVRGKSSDQLSSIPKLAAVYKLKIVKVPTNYDPVARTYDGSWDGTFKRAWTECPAWHVYDYLDNDIYGLRSYYPVNIDKWSYYEAAQWCDVKVSDGRGGLQPRYSSNLLLTDAMEGTELARYMAGAFNAVLTEDQDGSAGIKVDKDEQALHLFTPENVEDGEFNYTYTDPSTQYNHITVSFVNPELNWVNDRRIVQSQANIDKFGKVPHEFVAVGCTHDGEAIRRAQYKMITALTEREIVTFKTNRLGQNVEPFNIILISDPNAGYGLCGRMLSLNTARDEITLRDPLYLEAGISYTISVTLPDQLVERTLLNNTTGTTTTLSLDSPLPVGVPALATFTIGSVGLSGAPKPYRITHVEEIDADPDHHEITAIEVNRSKWDDADNVTLTDPIIYNNQPDPTVVPSPDAVYFLETYIRSQNEFHLTVDVTLNTAAYKFYNGEYEVYSRWDGSEGSWQKRELIGGDTIINHPSGDWEFKILPKTHIGTKTELNQARIWKVSLQAVVDPPADIPSFMYQLVGQSRQAIWSFTDNVGDLDGFRIRYQFGNNPTWSNAIPAYAGLVQTSPFNLNHLPKGPITIMIKAVDLSGVESENPAVIIVDQGDEIVANLIETHDHKVLGWPGTAIGGEIIDNTLHSQSVATFWKTDGDDPYWPADLNEQYWNNQFAKMIYVLTAVAPDDCWMTLELDVEGVTYNIGYSDNNNLNFWGAANDNFWKADTGDYFWDYNDLTTWPGKLWVKQGEVYNFEIILPAGTTLGKISNLKVNFDVDDVLETFEDLAISPSGTRLPLTKNYRSIRNVKITMQDDGGDAVVVKVANKDPVLGPLLVAINNNGTNTTASVDIQVQGY